MAPALFKAEVHYRQGTAEEHCGNCVMFHPDGLGTGRCDLVMGLISAHMVCNRWEARKD